MSTPNVLHALFCEHVRPEESGKTTLLGVWGAQCRFFTAAPTVMPNLGIHAFVHNPDQVPLSLVLTLQATGWEDGIRVEMEAPTEKGKIGHNINLNFANLIFTEPGPLTATLSLSTTPPTEHQIVLDVVFAPPATT